MRPIDADERKQQLENPYTEYPIMIQLRKVLKDFIDDAPTIDLVRHGEWKSKMLDKFRKYEVVCSECGAKYIGNYDAYDEPYDFNYCPNCGAQMDGARKIGHWVDHVKDFWCSECGCRILPEQVCSFSVCPKCNSIMSRE